MSVWSRSLRRGTRWWAQASLSMALVGAPASAWADSHHEDSAEEHGKGPASASHGHELREGHGDHAGGEHGGGHGGHGGHALPDINWFDFSKPEQPPFAALAINFALLLGIYIYFGREPIAQGLANRRQSIAKEIEDAQRIRTEAETRAQTYQAKLRQLDAELAQARESVIETGKGEQNRIIREAEERAARMQRDAQLLLEQEQRQMRNDLQRETVDLAALRAEEILKSAITQADHERLADEFLKELENQKFSTAGGVS